MKMPNRTYTAGGGYRYGFNGKEEDDEVKGDGNQQDYGMRIYDTRLGRFLSNDPLSKNFPWYSPYHFAGCNPIRNVDLDGGEPLDFKENWLKSTLVDGKTGIEAWSAIDMNGQDYHVIYDKITKKAWFIHEGNNGQYEYWQHNPGANEQQYIVSNTGRSDNGQWKPFQTANQIWHQNLMASMDDFEMLMVGGIVGGVALPAAIGEGTAFVTYQATDIAVATLMKYWYYAPVAGDAGRKAAEFLDESGSINSGSGGTKLLSTTFEEGKGLLGAAFKFDNGETLEFLSNRVINGKTLELTDAILYPKGAKANEKVGEFGKEAITSLLDKLKEYAKTQGFEQLRLTYKRVENSSSVNPGHTVDKTFNLLE